MSTDLSGTTLYRVSPLRMAILPVMMGVLALAFGSLAPTHGPPGNDTRRLPV